MEPMYLLFAGGPGGRPHLERLALGGCARPSVPSARLSAWEMLGFAQRTGSHHLDTRWQNETVLIPITCARGLNTSKGLSLKKQ